MMDTPERFYIFQETKINNQINDMLTIKPNIIFETIVQEDPHRGLPAAYKHLTQSYKVSTCAQTKRNRAIKTSPEGRPPLLER
jgi:hypothetical protein